MNIDKKQLLDKKIFDKAIKVIKSKSKIRTKGLMFSRWAIKFEKAINTYDVMGCAKVINELKRYFDGTEKKPDKELNITRQALFLKAVRNISQLITYHRGEQKEKHWESFTILISWMRIRFQVFDMDMHGHIFSEWPKWEQEKLN
tara:strand:- start:1951 stop:2385 length:435 start_codon:yes stop_codon:yes gene_type:complete